MQDKLLKIYYHLRQWLKIMTNIHKNKFTSTIECTTPLCSYFFGYTATSSHSDSNPAQDSGTAWTEQWIQHQRGSSTLLAVWKVPTNYLTSYFLPIKPLNLTLNCFSSNPIKLSRASLVAQTVKCLGSIPRSGRSPGEGNSYPLQYSCLESSMNRRSGWATVHGVTKSWTWLKN